jgi:hypothetical protein
MMHNSIISSLARQAAARQWARQVDLHMTACP